MLVLTLGRICRRVSRGFHERVTVRALNRADEWGPSDHCRLLIEVAAG